MDEDLVEGEIYKVEGFNDETIKIVDRNGFSSWHNKNLFEPVPSNDMSKPNSEIDISETKLKELLKTGRARCTFDSGMLYLTKGKSYNVWGGYDSGNILVIDDSNMAVPYPLSYFEPVCGVHTKSETAEYNTKVSFESSFKVGNKVYCPSMLDGVIYTVKVNSNYPNNGCKLFVINDHEDCYDFDEQGSNQYNNPIVYHATEENHQALQVLHPDIKFELPPKEITRSDLTKEMFKRGTFAVVCKCSDTSEISAIAMSPLRLIVGYSDGYFEENNGTYWKFAVPYDPITRVPLRQDVLNDIN